MEEKKFDVKVVGIAWKTIKQEDELVEKYVVKFEVICDDFDDAVSISKDLKTKLAHRLKGQSTLK